MPRSLTLLALSLAIAVPAFAQTPCSLDISLTCTGSNCSSTVRNIGANSCTGEYFVGIFVNADPSQASVTNFQQSLGLSFCFDSGSLAVPSPFAGCFGTASLGPGNSFTMSGHVNLTGAPSSSVLAITEVFDSVTDEDLGLFYIFNNSTQLTCTPRAFVPPVVQSGNPYSLSWSAVSDSTATFTVDESTAADFSANLVTRAVSAFSTQFQHTATVATTYYYRVSAVSCAASPGSNSATTSVVVQPIPTVTGRTGDVITPLGSTTPVIMKVFIGSSSTSPTPSGKQALDVPFTAATDKPYLSLSPSSGIIPPGGTTVTVTANPSALPPGANTGSLKVTASGATTTTSVSVSLTTPVAPGTKSLPPPNALIIPAVAHAPGALGPFQSDVRLTNGSAASIPYQITFTPTATDGTRNGKSTTVNVDAGQTVALNDVLRDFFGVGATDAASDAGQGSLEIRPLNTSTTQNYAASRTFTFNSKGTFGQFIAAIPFSTFATNASLVPIGGGPPGPNPVLSLQQVAQSPKFRTNLGIVEGSGAPASGNIKVYNDAGTLMKTVPYSLMPGEHRQINAFISANGIPILDDGRIEITVESLTGAVSAYASVLDNITNDPLAVMPVQASQVSSTRYVLPGMAALGGVNNFRSDIRIYNGGTTSATVTPTFYPQGGGTPVAAAPFSVAPGTVKAYDDVINSVFSSNGLGGSIVMTTSSPTSLVATGRTYTVDSSGGTFGQFIPGVTQSQGVGLGDRALQVLQLEQSTNFRSNLGIAELSGNAATVRVTAYIPDSKITASIDVTLGPNQFVQLNQVLGGSGFYSGQDIFNARISVQVMSGAGRITAYGSVIDNASLDPTYVPAQ